MIFLTYALWFFGGFLIGNSLAQKEINVIGILLVIVALYLQGVLK